MFVYSGIPIVSMNKVQPNLVQGYFIQNNQRNKRQNLKPHSKFSEEEDSRLRELVERHGENSWIEIASLMPGRNSRQCRERWLNYLSPHLNTKAWTSEEDSLLLEKQKELGTSWVRISKYFEGRTDQMCKNRFFLLRRKLEKKPHKRRNMSIVQQQTPTIIRTPFFFQFPTNNNIINNNNNLNYFQSTTTISSTMSSPISSSMNSPIQPENKEEIYSMSEDQETTEPELDFDEPILGETTDLGFAETIYQESVNNSYENECEDIFSNFGSIESVEDLFSF